MYGLAAASGSPGPQGHLHGSGSASSSSAPRPPRARSAARARGCPGHGRWRGTTGGGASAAVCCTRASVSARANTYRSTAKLPALRVPRLSRAGCSTAGSRAGSSHNGQWSTALDDELLVVEGTDGVRELLRGPHIGPTDSGWRGRHTGTWPGRGRVGGRLPSRWPTSHQGLVGRSSPGLCWSTSPSRSRCPRTRAGATSLRDGSVQEVADLFGSHEGLMPRGLHRRRGAFPKPTPAGPGHRPPLRLLRHAIDQPHSSAWPGSCGHRASRVGSSPLIAHRPVFWNSASWSFTQGSYTASRCLDDGQKVASWSSIQGSAGCRAAWWRSEEC